MFSRFLKTWLTGAVCMLPLFAGAARTQKPPDVLRVCADPNNLPFSNLHELGFENKIASLLSNALQEKLSYTWWVERDNLAKNTLNANRCDLLLGVPVGLEDVSTTQPYYRSTYVFVSRKDRHLHLQSLYDSQLAQLRIGVHVLGDGFSPPNVVLARLGIRSQVVGYSMLGAYGEPNPPARLTPSKIRTLMSQLSGARWPDTLRNTRLLPLTSFRFLPITSEWSPFPTIWRWPCGSATWRFAAG